MKLLIVCVFAPYHSYYAMSETSWSNALLSHNSFITELLLDIGLYHSHLISQPAATENYADFTDVEYMDPPLHL